MPVPHNLARVHVAILPKDFTQAVLSHIVVQVRDFQFCATLRQALESFLLLLLLVLDRFLKGLLREGFVLRLKLLILSTSVVETILLKNAALIFLLLILFSQISLVLLDSFLEKLRATSFFVTFLFFGN
jgi:hypothetical protein